MCVRRYRMWSLSSNCGEANLYVRPALTHSHHRPIALELPSARYRDVKVHACPSIASRTSRARRAFFPFWKVAVLGHCSGPGWASDYCCYWMGFELRLHCMTCVSTREQMMEGFCSQEGSHRPRVCFRVAITKY